MILLILKICDKHTKVPEATEWAGSLCACTHTYTPNPSLVYSYMNIYMGFVEKQRLFAFIFSPLLNMIQAICLSAHLHTVGKLSEKH